MNCLPLITSYTLPLPSYITSITYTWISSNNAQTQASKIEVHSRTTKQISAVTVVPKESPELLQFLHTQHVLFRCQRSAFWIKETPTFKHWQYLAPYILHTSHWKYEQITGPSFRLSTYNMTAAVPWKYCTILTFYNLWQIHSPYGSLVKRLVWKCWKCWEK